MKLNEAINSIKEMCNATQKQIIDEIGIKQGAFTTMMKRNNMQVKTLIGIADALDYEVVLRPKKGTNKTERSVIIDMAGAEE